MRIVHIIPGNGGSFYCQNCIRDGALVKSIQEAGHDIIMVPMYLPLVTDEPDMQQETPVFFGAVNAYLKQIWPWFRNAPRWLEKFFDSSLFLNLAARSAGSTSAAGLEDMTLSMLRGEDGNQSGELHQLIRWLKSDIRPDVVYIANSLLLGLVPGIRQELEVPIVCALQDEAPWLESMDSEKLQEIWDLMRLLARDVDCFLPVSSYYGRIMTSKLEIPSDRIRIIPNGIDAGQYRRSGLPDDPVTVGYLSRQMPGLGLDILTDAFILLRNQHSDLNMELKITGGMTRDDLPFVKAIKRKLKRSGLLQDVHFIENHDREHRIEFLQSLTLMTVPTQFPEAFGTFILEAMACGVPVIQPNIGAYPEIIRQGGWIYHPNNAETLAGMIWNAAADRSELEQKSNDARQLILDHYDIGKIADELTGLYHHLIRRKK